MGRSQSGLEKQQEQGLVNLARRALNEGRYIDAVTLVGKVGSFWHQNLITLLSVCASRESGYVKEWASRLFEENLARCATSTGLIPVALWLRNPKRSFRFSEELSERIDAKRRELEPDWNGIWKDPGLEGNSAYVELLHHKSPEDVSDPDICLSVASQAGDWGPWLSRYFALGGSPKNPRYLKIRIAKEVASQREPSRDVMRMLQLYSEVGDPHAVRSFLRRITPIKDVLRGGSVNRKLARYALLVYCGFERWEHEVDDWTHIAQSALYLRHEMLQRLAQRGLAGIERTPTAHSIFLELTALLGEIPVTENAKRDIGPRGNPIWESVYRLMPVNRDARSMLIVYSNKERERS